MIACLNLLCVSECMYVYSCIYVCMYDVRHDIQIPCTRYVAINRLFFIIKHEPRTVTCKAYVIITALLHRVCISTIVLWKWKLANTKRSQAMGSTGLRQAKTISQRRRNRLIWLDNIEDCTWSVVGLLRAGQKP